jgi:NhaP-type Na+/H+ or K+/H+ antiporter
MFNLVIAALIGSLFGVLVGYLWRDRISRARRATYRVEQEMRRAPEMDWASIRARGENKM